MARIKTKRGTKRLNGPNPRTRTGGSAAPRDTADVSSVSGGLYLNYYLSAAAFAVAKEWTNGCDIEWDTGDDPGDPVIARLTPAAGRGFTLRQRAAGQERPHFVLPTGDVGIPDIDTGLNPVTEGPITTAVITIKLPFAFRRDDVEEAATAEATTEATENVEA